MARIAKTKQALITALGEPASTVYRLARHPDCPRRADGSWDVEAVRAWMLERRVDRAEKAAAARHEVDESRQPPRRARPVVDAPEESEHQAADPSGPRWTDVRTRKALVETQRALLELQLRKGELVRRDKVAEMLSTRMAALRRRCQSAARVIGRKCGEQLGADPMAVEEIALEHLLDILRDVYGKVPSDIGAA